jgi:hypothetical protein
MTDVILRVVIAAVRAWTRIYTWRMEPSLRDARRAEIDSDLWECQSDDRTPRLLVVQIAGRLVAGVFHDLQWRIEQVGDRRRAARRSMLVTLGAGGLAAGAWIALATSSVELPQPPAAPPLVARRAQYPVPPPPPPPPCPPPGLGLPRARPCTP